MARVFLIVLDSVGCGGAPDAAAYGDEGADTMGHIAQACAEGRADRPGLRSGPLAIPNLVALGFAHACEMSARRPLAGITLPDKTEGRWGFAIERSHGKDTPSGHWELAGCPVLFDWGYFRKPENSLPKKLIDQIVAVGGLPGILGNCHASGVTIIDQLGAEHVATGKPIIYTSVDSVIQIAAHEEAFGLDRLIGLCSKVRPLADAYNIGRVIARPFVGNAETGFVRTANRKDFSTLPPFATLFDRCAIGGRPRISIGKIGDIFAHRHTGEELKGASNDAHVAMLLDAMDRLPDGGFCMVNLVDFDTEFGHRRDVAGYAACLEAFDRHVPAIRQRLRLTDMAIITADHGNDPTWTGTDHTRENVPVVAFGPRLGDFPLGKRESFADVAAAVGDWLEIGLVGPGARW
jgi:phosphopentomutase